MMSYFFPTMLCSPYGEISTLKACKIIAYGLYAHRFKDLSHTPHARCRRAGGCKAPDSRAALATRAACTQGAQAKIPRSFRAQGA